MHTASFLTTSSLLKPDTYPQFASDSPAVWATGAAGAFEPFDGSWYVYSQRADVSYKRLLRTIDLTGVSAADAPTLTFRMSYDTEPDWDFVFVEAHTLGQDDWTTLPDVNGHTGTSTGESCAEGWFELHPWLERYQGADCSGANAVTGGEWNAATGRSAGWEEWKIDLSAYAGSTVELSISYASDWGFQGLGSFVDAIDVSTGEGSTSFETGMDGWTIQARLRKRPGRERLAPDDLGGLRGGRGRLDERHALLRLRARGHLRRGGAGGGHATFHRLPPQPVGQSDGLSPRAGLCPPSVLSSRVASELWPGWFTERIAASAVINRRRATAEGRS